MIRVVLPFHLRNLARVEGELEIEVAGPVTVQSVLDALEARYPVLQGTIRDHTTKKRRPFIRFFACREDLSLEPQDTPLPEAVIRGDEPFLVVGRWPEGDSKKSANASSHLLSSALEFRTVMNATPHACTILPPAVAAGADATSNLNRSA